MNIRSNFVISLRLLLLFMMVYPLAAAPALAQVNIIPGNLPAQGNTIHPLDFESRLACRLKVEQVYWDHRIWPDQNNSPKPALEQVLPASALQAKVEDEVRQSNALAVLWQQPITGEQLQAELDRMTRNTQLPVVLAEIYTALDHDPYLMAECLARPALSVRLLQSNYAESGLDQPFDTWWLAERSLLSTEIEAPEYTYRFDTPIQIQGQDDTWTPTPALPEGLAGSTAVWTGTEMIVFGGVGASSGARTNSGSRYNPATDTWTTVAALGAPEPRAWHVAVWTGTKMIVWAGCNQSPEFCDTASGGLYDPLTDSWTPTDFAGAPYGRLYATAVWTGSRMIVWGGCSIGSQGNNYCNINRNDGGIYDPDTNTWQPTSTASAPSGRTLHEAVWTDGVMVVWGGHDGIGVTNTGGRYNLATNSWQPTTTAGAPSARANHTMVSTGTQAVVWGGCTNSLCLGGDTYFGDGAIYDPAADTWTPTTLTGAPAGRSNHSAVWTGSEMIIWGGRNGPGANLNTGGRYDPVTDSWIPTSTSGAPSARSDHHAVWTGNEMIVWGGTARTGGRYDPTSDTWISTSTNDPVYAKERHQAVWTGTEMLSWGGSTACCGEYFGFGNRFDLVTGVWSLMSDTNEPEGRYFHTAVWTGSEMIVWGGQYGTVVFDTGGRYNPITDTWTATSLTGAPEGRAYHTAVWTGSEMIVWGGATYTEFYSNTGGRYNPSTNSWTATTTTGAPSPRAYIKGVWTGEEFIVWGGMTDTGDTNTGGRYDPASNSWTATSTTGAPTGRHFNTALWTGSLMLVWGGMSGNLDNGTWYNTGGRYDPLSNTWTPISTSGAPSPRIWHVDAWTGVEMIVWSGCTGNTSCWDTLYTGGRYNPLTDSWTSTSLQSVPRERANAAAVWTGEGLLVWGGFAGDVGTYTTTGGLYSVSYGPNTPPAALDDAYFTDEGVPLVVLAPGVLANDTDADGDTLTALLVSNPTHGSLVLMSDGSFTYDPDPGFNGSDSFSYRASDGTTQSGIAAVTITVSATNDAPVANVDSYWLPANTTLNVTAPGVLANDSDPDGDPLSTVLLSGPASGSLTLNADGSFSYTPDTDFLGTDWFTYQASDGSLQSAETTVTLTVVDPALVSRIYLPAVHK